MAMTPRAVPHEVRITPPGLAGLLGVPDNPKGLVLFAHGSGSGRLSPRNNYVAEALRRAHIATLLMDLLRPEEEQDRAKVFDIELLASRLVASTAWCEHHLPALRGLPVGYFGASTGGGAALVAAAEQGDRIAAVVSRGGRPDLAGEALGEVRTPTLLIVGSLDGPVIELNRQAQARITGAPCELTIVPGAGHLFVEPGTLDQVIEHARDWFLRCFTLGAWTEPGHDRPPSHLR